VRFPVQPSLVELRPDRLLTSPIRSESIALPSANSPRTRRSGAVREISQGKTQNFITRKRWIYKAHPCVDGGLNGHVRIYPDILSGFVTPRFWIVEDPGL
jgi:hypothetical protein